MCSENSEGVLIVKKMLPFKLKEKKPEVKNNCQSLLKGKGKAFGCVCCTEFFICHLVTRLP